VALVITANFINRTFRIRCGDSIGTAFTIDVDNRQYLVTARHVVQAFDPAVGIDLFVNGTWTTAPTQLVGHGAGQIDVSVLTAENPMSPPDLPVLASSNGLAYGQEVFFLGFPYDILGNIVFTDQGYPLPLAKRATMSCFAGDIFLLDGHNNPGFSGGPVLFSPRGGPPTNIGGVISGYRIEQERVYYGSEPTDLSFRYNTGIIISYKVEAALSLIEGNPIGALL